MLQDLTKISDGKIYAINDMVRAACNDCEGCHSCCSGMGDSIVLDPYDMWCLMEGTGKNFDELYLDALELGVADGVVLPHLKMTGEKEQCFFLNEEGRCSVHAFRPGLCRLFPLGRLYEEDGIKYFLQPDACQKTSRSKVKVSKWLGIPEQKKNEEFLLKWHDFRAVLEKILAQMGDDAGKTLNMFVIKLFYISLYDAKKDFYEEFDARIQQMEAQLGL